MRCHVLACLLLTGILAAADDVVWVTITYDMPGEDQTNAAMGCLPRAVLTTIEDGTYDRRFVKLTDLRFWSDEEERYLSYADDYDAGIVLIPCAGIRLIDYLQGDPKAINDRLEPLREKPVRVSPNDTQL